MSAEDPSTITLSLISHTNAGKTTLKRTLLRRDVGQVDDQPHVTQSNDSDILVESGDQRMVLWDTPGFGILSDTLLKRLRNSERPVVSFLAERWDRIANRSLWSSQMAVKNIREESDVVLYLVDLWQEPEELDFHVGQEMELLHWLGKPVIVLLNKTGTTGNDSAAAVAEWRERLGADGEGVVREVMELDAFSRCWVQEVDLMKILVDHLPAEKREPCRKLVATWNRANFEVFRQSTEEIGQVLAHTVLDAEAIPSSGLTREALSQLRGLYGTIAKKALGPLARLLPGTDFENTAFNRALTTARTELETRAVGRFGELMSKLIALHGLRGKAGRELEELAEAAFAIPPREMEEVSAFAIGTILGLAGLGVAAEVAAGGLTGGAVVAALMVGPGAALLAKGYNLALDKDRRLRWADDHLHGQFRQMLLAYLAVAHFGRGRGEWKPGHAASEGEGKTHWQEAVHAVVSEHSNQLGKLWKKGREREVDSVKVYEESVELARECSRELLLRLHPGTEWGA